MWTAITAVVILGFGAPQKAAEPFGPPIGELPETTQEGKLSVANERLTYGHLGPTRPTAVYLPGDVIHLDFEVRNLKFDVDGRAIYATTLEVVHADGKIMFRKDLPDTSAVNNFGGDSLPCAAHLRIPLETAAGAYTLRVILRDRGSGQTVQVERKVEVAPAGFGLVQVGTSADREGNLPWSPIGRVGDAIYFNFSVVGFGREAKTKQPDVQITLRILDEKGKQVNTTKLTGAAKGNVPESFRMVPMQFGLTLNRPGRFTLELTAVDHVSGKQASLSFPLQIVASP
jgi:hypothetical protein